MLSELVLWTQVLMSIEPESEADLAAFVVAIRGIADVTIDLISAGPGRVIFFLGGRDLGFPEVDPSRVRRSLPPGFLFRSFH